MTKAACSEPGYADPEFVARRRALDETTLPRACTHDEALELYRRSQGAPRRRPRPTHCHQCGHALPSGGPLRARDVPGLTHAIIFFALSWALYLLNPYPPLRAEVAMWTTWLVCFALGLGLRTPLRSARNALVILFSVSWLHFFARYWSVITLEYLFWHSLHKWADCFFATTPIFFAVGVRALIARLRARRRDAGDEF